jgi:tRNA nucleotidyltransferase (CCA-adding enzyme)
MKALLTAMKKKLEPSAEERKQVEKTINKFLERLRHDIQAAKIDATVELGGSFAKNTWLASEFDVDIFVRFTHDDGSISDKLHKLLPEAERVHGSRDYYRLECEGTSYEIVPVLYVDDTTKAINVTDCSPLHVKWVQEHGSKYLADIRLAKQFSKSAGVYGAESHIAGFSGHVLDILVIHYKGFSGLLKASQKWKEKTVIDTSNHYSKQPLHHLNTSKTSGPLVVIDPIQKTRNASAALSEKMLKVFQKRAANFLKKPSETYFELPVYEASALTSKGYYIVVLEPHEGKRDVVGAQLLKIYTHLRKELSDFELADTGWDWKQGLLWFKFSKTTLPATLLHSGPPTAMKEAAKAFRKKHQTVSEVKGRLQATVAREHTTIESALAALLTESYITERSKSTSWQGPTSN